MFICRTRTSGSSKSGSGFSYIADCVLKSYIFPNIGNNIEHSILVIFPLFDVMTDSLIQSYPWYLANRKGLLFVNCRWRGGDPDTTPPPHFNRINFRKSAETGKELSIFGLTS